MPYSAQLSVINNRKTASHNKTLSHVKHATFIVKTNALTVKKGETYQRPLAVENENLVYVLCT